MVGRHETQEATRSYESTDRTEQNGVRDSISLVDIEDCRRCSRRVRDADDQCVECVFQPLTKIRSECVYSRRCREAQASYRCEWWSIRVGALAVR